jgi:uncharacterized protein (DUF2147 family)
MTILLAILAAASMPADAAVGRWQTENRHGVVEIARCGSSICGTLLSSDGLRANPQLRDEKNKDAQLRSRPLKDLRILQGFQWKSGSWSGGTIYNAEGRRHLRRDRHRDRQRSFAPEGLHRLATVQDPDLDTFTLTSTHLK